MSSKNSLYATTIIEVTAKPLILIKNKKILDNVDWTLNSPYPTVDIVINIFQYEFLYVWKFEKSMNA